MGAVAELSLTCPQTQSSCRVTDHLIIQPGLLPGLVLVLPAIGGAWQESAHSTSASHFPSPGSWACQEVLWSSLIGLAPNHDTCQLVRHPTSAGMHPFWILGMPVCPAA